MTTYESFGYIAEMSLWDQRGRCRCPGCGKYRRREDIPRDQSTCGTFGDEKVRAIVHYSPVCNQCLTSPITQDYPQQNPRPAWEKPEVYPLHMTGDKL